MAESLYTVFTEKLQKLQRNESQMTEQQKEQYAEQLKALRQGITGMAGAFARQYILGAATQLKDGADAEECTERVQAITRSNQSRAEYKEAIAILFSTYDFNKFLVALLPIHYRVRYEGYAPYWCKHCTPYTGTSYNGKPLTFWNDIIGMGWCEETRLWYREDKNTISLSLPPTMEQAMERYRYNMQEWTDQTAPMIWKATK